MRIEYHDNKLRKLANLGGGAEWWGRDCSPDTRVDDKRKILLGFNGH